MVKVSINISCFNRSKLLKECLESFINQTFENFEIIVVDDGSTEDLSFIIGLDPRIKYFRQEHGGMAKGLNLALTKSSGKFVMPFGSDDTALPNLLEKEVEILENNPQYDVVFCDQWLLKNGKLKRKKYSGININNQKKFYKEMLERQVIAHGGTLWRKDKYISLDENIFPAEDWELFLSSVEKGLKFFHIPERLWIYSVMSKDRMSNLKEMNIACEKILNKRDYTFNKKKRIGEKICQL